MNDTALTSGTQITYVPTHAHGDAKHRDCEQGFVERDEGNRVLCRFFRRDGKGLRTCANGEWCSRNSLVVQVNMEQGKIEDAIRQMYTPTASACYPRVNLPSGR